MGRRTARAEAGDRRKQFHAVARRFEGFRPAREVLTTVRAVPTRFVQLDHATRVGGLPIERFMLIHGPSNQGKSLMTLGLCDSFLARDHFALYIDAERTTPGPWVEQLLGANAHHPGFFADRPESYEATIARVQQFLMTLADERKKGNLPPETSAIVVCDSLRKLVPRDMMKEILDAERDANEVKGGRDRSAQLKAKMNAAWMDELVPLLEHAQAGFVAIAREMVDPDANHMQKRFGTDYKVGGGGAIFYDAALVMRVDRGAWVQHGEGEARKVYGEKHRVTIKKTKVAGKDDKQVVCFFHSSNGVLTAPGFDRARDVLDLAERFGVVEKSGSWFAYAGERIAAGAHNAVKALADNAPLLASLEGAVRAKFEAVAPTEMDGETGEVA